MYQKSFGVPVPIGVRRLEPGPLDLAAAELIARRRRGRKHGDERQEEKTTAKHSEHNGVRGESSVVGQAGRASVPFQRVIA